MNLIDWAALSVSPYFFTSKLLSCSFSLLHRLYSTHSNHFILSCSHLQGRKTLNHVALSCELWWSGEEEEEEGGVGRHLPQIPLQARSHGQHSHQVQKGPGEWRRGSGLAAVRGQPSVQGRFGSECVVWGAVPAQHTAALCLPQRHDPSTQVKNTFMVWIYCRRLRLQKENNASELY